MAEDKKLLSLIVPVYFEEAVIEAFYRRVLLDLLPISPEFELEFIFVNDGSKDQSLQILLDLRQRDPRIKILHFSRNFGHQTAVTAGVDHALGDVVAIIDADLQDPPHVILNMLAKWREGFKVVYGVRGERKGESHFKLLTAKLFYRLLSSLSDVKIPLDTGDFRLMDRTVVEALRGLREESRYIRGMVSWLGFQQCGVEYSRDPRFAGESNYPLRKMIRFALNGITSFSEKPLVFSAWFGGAVTCLGFLFMGWVIIGKFRHPAQSVDGWTSLISVILFFGGIQLLSLGILGQYIGRVYREVKRRPLYVLEKAWGVDCEPYSGSAGRP